ncbi:MAG: ANTAR domain-containing protein [Actinomycetota bacterium]|nr:ANTAR domain-containing protein [Actinomycetota bacterium]
MPDVAVGLRRLTSAIADELGLIGATVALRTSTGNEAVTASSGDGHQGLDELEFSLGEGPGVDALSVGRPMLEFDLASASGRWPGYAPAAVRAGARAAYAFPLQLGAVRFGVLTLYSSTARRLENHELSQCLIFAEVATELLLDSSTSGSADRPDPDLQEAMHIRTEVYQAQGMVTVALDVSLGEALARMRAFAYAEGYDLNGLAAAIVARRIRLTRDGPPTR